MPMPSVTLCSVKPSTEECAGARSSGRERRPHGKPLPEVMQADAERHVAGKRGFRRRAVAASDREQNEECGSGAQKLRP